MYHSLSTSSSYGDAFFSGDGTAMTPPLSAGAFLDPGAGAFLTSLSSSLPSSYYQLQRSNSSHCLPLHHHYAPDLLAPLPQPFFATSSPPPPLPSSPSSTSGDFASAGPVRRVFSTGDLEEQSYGAQEGGAGAGGSGARVGRYSAEERKERIEKYRSKRNQRNFQKKITYACRKTLADSRPRVKGRFARNGEAETEAEAEIGSGGGGGYDVVNYCGNAGDGGSSNGVPEWWAEMQAALEREEETEEGSFCDEELLAAYFGVSTMNLLSN